MTVYTIITQQPETPIVESLLWNSDVIVGDNGSEQRISLSRVPKRTIKGTFRFDSKSSLRRYTNQLYSVAGQFFNFPYWQWSIKIKNAIAAGVQNIPITSKRSQFRVGGLGIIMDGDVYELFIVQAVTATYVRATGGLANSYSRRALVAPVRAVATENNAVLSRTNTDGTGSASFTFLEYSSQSPFVDPLNTQTLTTFDGIPVLDKIPTGTEFTDTIDTGAEITDYGGQMDIRSRWATYQMQMPRSFQCNRLFNPDEWNWWQVFLDYCRGPVNPFYYPSHVADFGIVGTPATGNTMVVVEGDDYSDLYEGDANRQCIVFTNEDGLRHYAKVTDIANVGGNDRLTFSPALPAGEWGSATLSFLLKCRLSQDTVECTHDNVQTTVPLVLRTVPDDLP